MAVQCVLKQLRAIRLLGGLNLTLSSGTLKSDPVLGRLDKENWSPCSFALKLRMPHSCPCTPRSDGQFGGAQDENHTRGLVPMLIIS